MELTTFWFILIAVLWTGYFFLEGFDFGVGMLLHPLGRTETDRRVLINTIGPVWDGNEVWLLTAGGATFAAFPNWYATLFSGFYLALFLILVALILRGVAFEYRGKVDSDSWRRAGTWPSPSVRGCRRCCGASPSPTSSPGCRSTRNGDFTGTLFTLLNPFGLLGGWSPPRCSCSTAPLPGAQDRGRDPRRRPAAALRIAPVTIVAGAVFLLWNQIERGTGLDVGPVLVAAVALVGLGRGHAGRP
jgi:cytochrome d ubiquinol oxidase subunit II